MQSLIGQSADSALLADAFVSMTDHTSLSDETVRRRLREKKVKPGSKKCGASPTSMPSTLPRMEDVCAALESDGPASTAYSDSH